MFRRSRNTSSRKFNWIPGVKNNLSDTVRKNQRALNKAMRELDRERIKMEMEEKKMILEIRKNAKEGHLDAAKILAKDLVQVRRYKQKFLTMKASIQAVSLKILTLRSQCAMTEAIKGVTLAMREMNHQIRLPQLQAIIRDFARQTGFMEMREERLNEVTDEVCEVESDDDEADGVIVKVFDELGLQVSDQLANLPAGTLPAPRSAVAAAHSEKAGPSSSLEDDPDADLHARLDNLRKL